VQAIELNRNDDNYSLISYVCAYALHNSVTYIGHIHKFKSPEALSKNFLPPSFYILTFDHVDFTLKIESNNLNDLIRIFEFRCRVRALIPLCDRNLYLTNTIEW
jgi:hypothetical protein